MRPFQLGLVVDKNQKHAKMNEYRMDSQGGRGLSSL